MHPIFADRDRLILYMAVWLVLAGLLCLLLVLLNGFTWGEAGALLFPMALVYAFMCLASLYLCRAFPLQETPFLKTAAVVVAASLLSSLIWIAIGKGLATFLAQSEFSSQINAKFDGTVPFLFGIGVSLFTLSLVIHYLLLAFDTARAAEKKALQLQVLAREAELKALRSQIQPHFLFNSLNSISALTTSDATAARAMSLKLAEFFRKTLKLGQEQFVTIEEEFRLAADFLSIERLRFGPRLSFDMHLDDEIKDIPVPSLILQPLVENAVSHGVAHLIEGGTIVLAATKNASALKIVITNPCDAERPKSKGTSIGLANVKKRLDALYGNEAHLSCEDGPTLFRVEMSIPTKISSSSHQQQE
jgi:two-component system sensor histidine kinase AlgZ